MGNLGHIQWGKYGSDPRIYRWWGRKVDFPWVFLHLSSAMRFCKMMLWDSKDRGGT
jgi:hypothetical protein